MDRHFRFTSQQNPVFAGKPRLADSRLARDKHRFAFSVERSTEPASQLGELPVTAEKAFCGLQGG